MANPDFGESRSKPPRNEEERYESFSHHTQEDQVNIYFYASALFILPNTKGCEGSCRTATSRMTTIND